MNFVDLLALSLALRACLDAWFQEDSILAERRARTQLWRSEFWRSLFNCRFCMSYWVPGGLLILFGVSIFLSGQWPVIVKLPIYALAITGLSGLFDWLITSRTRTVVIKTENSDSHPVPDSGSDNSSASTKESDERSETTSHVS